MNVLFIQEPIEDFYETKFRNYPLGLLYLASQLDAKVHKIKILDFRFHKKTKTIKTPAEFSYLEKYYTKENKLFLTYKRFGFNFEKIEKVLQNENFDFVCLNSMFTCYSDEIFKLAELIKSINPKVKVAVGGFNATANFKIFFENDAFDYIVRGEGEEILPKLLAEPKNFSRLIDDDKKPLLCKNLNLLKNPNLNLINNDNYLYNKNRYTMVLSSRGCSNACSFCSVQSMYNNTYRLRDIELVFDEIVNDFKTNNIRVFDFQDDNLLSDLGRIKTLFERLLLKFDSNNDLEFMASNGLNAINIDFELLRLMKKLNFKKLDLSLATGNVSSRKDFKRPESIIQYENVLNMANSLNFMVTTYVILGYPEQSLKDMYETFYYLKKQNTLISPSIYYNVPGMPIFENFKKYDYNDADVFRRSTCFNSYGIDFTRDDIFKLFKEIRAYNLSKL